MDVAVPAFDDTSAAGRLDGGVDVWIALPDSVGESASDVLEALLSHEERERARAFAFAHHRRAYVVSHALLRVALARYATEEPDALVLTTSESGRPALVGAPGEFDFSLTHTDTLAAVAVSHGGAVGVDAEDVDRACDDIEIADRYFHASEADTLRELAPVPRRHRFLEFWTLKEAYTKACGLGLSLPLDQVSFTLGPAGQPTAGFSDELVREQGGWQFIVLRPTSRHVLAVARQGPSPLRPRLLTVPVPALCSAARARP